MQENPGRLFADLKNQLNRFISNFEIDNANMHLLEKEALEKLKKIASSIDEKITGNFENEHGIILARIVGIKPQKEIRWLFSTTVLKLPDAIDTMVKTLNSSLETFKKDLDEKKKQSTEKLIQEAKSQAETEKERIRLETEKDKDRIRLEKENAEQQFKQQLEMEKLRIEEERKKAESEKERIRLESEEKAKQEAQKNQQQIELEKMRMQQEKEKIEQQFKQQLDMEKLRLEEERKKAETEKERIRLEKEKELETEKLRLQQFEKERENERNKLEEERKKREAEKEVNRKRKREEEDKRNEQQQKMLDKLTQASDELKAAKNEVKTSYANGLRDGENALITDVHTIIKDESKSKEERINLFVNRLKINHAGFFLTQGSANGTQQQTQSNDNVIISHSAKENTEAKNLIGDAKYKVVHELIEVCNNSEVAEQEKSLAKLFIFKLLVHKNDMTINEIIADISKLLLETRAFDAKSLTEKFPNIFNGLSKFKTLEDNTSMAPLNFAELKGFDKLYRDKFLPEDISATNYFTHAAAISQRQIIKDPMTEEKYTERFLDKKMPNNNTFQTQNNKQLQNGKSHPTQTITAPQFNQQQQ